MPSAVGEEFSLEGPAVEFRVLAEQVAEKFAYWVVRAVVTGKALWERVPAASDSFLDFRDLVCR